MSFVFYQSTGLFDLSSQQTKQSLLFTIHSKKDRKEFSKFVKAKQFLVPNIKIKLTCFPKLESFQKYNSCASDETLRSDVTELIRTLNMDGYLVVAEVLLSS